MSDFIDFWITIDEEYARYQIGDEELQVIPHHLHEEFAKFQKLEGTRKYGSKLFDSLFSPDNAKQLRTFIEQGIGNTKKDFHFRLNIEDPKLEQLYWESLRYEDIGLAFGKIDNVFLSRYTSSLEFELKQVSKIRVLVIISEPQGEEAGQSSHPINRKEECAFLKTLEKEYGNDVEFTILEGPASVERIEHFLQNEDYEKSGEGFNVLYIISNGYVNDQGTFILLETDKDRKPDPTLVEDLRDTIQGKIKNHFQLVIFSPGQNSQEKTSEFTLSAASNMVKWSIPASIALRNGMNPGAIQLFTRHFFKQLVDSLEGNENISVDMMVNSTRKKIYFRFNRTSGGNDWIKPVLFMRGDGCLFEVKPVLSDPKSRKAKDMPKTEETDSLSTVIGIKNGKEGVIIFCCYPREDKKYLDQLELKKRQASLRRQRKIKEFFVDKENIPIGAQWESTIKDYLEKADLIIILLTANFLDSDFIMDKELPTAKERYKKGDADLFPIYFDYADYENDEFIKSLQLYPDGDTPLVDLISDDQPEKVKREAIHKINMEIGKMIKERYDKKNTKTTKGGLGMEEPSTSTSLKTNLKEKGEEQKIKAGTPKMIKGLTQSLSKKGRG